MLQQNQNQFSGLTTDLPARLPPGSLFVAKDTGIVYAYGANGRSNQLLSEQVNTGGWASYTDTQYTSGSPFVLPADSVNYTNIPNNAGTILDPQKPADVITFYDGVTGRFLGRTGDGISWSVEMKASVASNNSFLELGIDIGSGVSILYHDTFTFPKGIGVERNIIYSIPSAYTLDTWQANGGVLKARANNAVTIHSIRYVITRTHKAR